MLTIFGAQNQDIAWSNAVVCIGTFDGVHLGHQALIRRAVQRAAELEFPAVVVTFDHHPARVLAPDRCPPALGSLAQNLAHIAELGVAATVVLHFDAALATTRASTFLDEILVQTLHARELVIGHDFAFGKDREGTGEWVAERISAETFPPFSVDGHRVSSSEIRGAVQSGDVEHAARLLGRRFSLTGVVGHGEKLGRTLGYPTANLELPATLAIPGDGVYSSMARTRFGVFPAAVSIGSRPTVGDRPRVVEAYLLEYPGDSLYGTALSLEFLARVRGQERFNDLEQLKSQMASDIQQVALDARQ